MKTVEELLAEAQNMVGSHFPLDYYWEYMKSEVSYWGSIPRWLREDYRPSQACMDIGCAYGTLLAYLHALGHRELWGADQQRYLSGSLENMLAMTSACFGYTCPINVELAMVWPDSFDVIIMTEVLEHFNFYPTPTLRKVRDMLAPGGRLYLSTPNQEYWGPQHKYYKSLRDIPPPDPSKPFVDGHIWHYSKLELLTVLQEAGLRVLRFEGGRHFAVTVEAE